MACRGSGVRVPPAPPPYVGQVSVVPRRAPARAGARGRGLVKVAVAVFPDNERAIAVYEHAGFVREGLRRRQYRIRANGAEGYRDELLMAWVPPGRAPG